MLTYILRLRFSRHTIVTRFEAISGSLDPKSQLFACQEFVFLMWQGCKDGIEEGVLRNTVTGISSINKIVFRTNVRLPKV